MISRILELFTPVLGKEMLHFTLQIAPLRAQHMTSWFYYGWDLVKKKHVAKFSQYIQILPAHSVVNPRDLLSTMEVHVRYQMDLSSSSAADSSLTFSTCVFRCVQYLYLAPICQPQNKTSSPWKCEAPKVGTNLSNLVGGFNPFEKYWSNWIISPGRGENKKCLKPPPSNCRNLIILGIFFRPLFSLWGLDLKSGSCQFPSWELCFFFVCVSLDFFNLSPTYWKNIYHMGSKQSQPRSVHKNELNMIRLPLRKSRVSIYSGHPYPSQLVASDSCSIFPEVEWTTSGDLGDAMAFWKVM